MAKKSSTRKSLKSLFSRSEANLDASVQKDVEKSEAEKKKFKLFSFKTKSKSGSATEKSANEKQQVLSAVSTGKDGESLADSVVPDNKRSSIYATAPRAKGKEFSYSELDLRKPKKFGTFSFGLKKKKKKDEEDISKSTFVLPSQGAEVPEETPADLRQMELDQTNTKRFSMSQPELDSSSTFDIPSPPPVATNQSESHFTLPDQSQSSVTVHTQPESKEPLTNGFELLDVHEETLKAPIATIPELQLDDPGSPEEIESIPVDDNSSRTDATADPTPHTEATSVVTTANPQPSQPPIVLDSPNHKTAAVDSVCTSNSPCDDDILQQSDKKTESASDTLSHHHPPDAPDTADSAISSSEPSLANVDSRNDIPVTESTPVLLNDKSALSADSATIHRDVSISHTERPVPEPATGVTAASTVSSEKSTRPVNQDSVYGALYESLFPQSFTSEIMASLSSPSPQLLTEIRHLDTKTEPVMVKTLNECHTETNVMYSRLPTSHDLDSGARTVNDTPDFASLSERKATSSSESSRFTSYQDSTASQLQRKPEIHLRYVPSSVGSSSEPVGSDDTADGFASLSERKAISSSESSGFTSYQDSPPSQLERKPEIHVRYMPSSVSSSSEPVEGDNTVDAFPSLSERQVISSGESSTFTSYQDSTASQLERKPEIHIRYMPPSISSSSEPADGDNIPYSELTRSHSEVKSDRSGLVGDIVRSVPVSQNSAPPVTDYVTSHGTDAQVTDSKQRVILVKELVTDEASADPGCPSPVPDKRTAVKGLAIKIKTTESFSSPSGGMEGYDGPLSPAYLSVGSDDGSAVEIYYSAEEDNAEPSGDEEMFTMDEREETLVVYSGREGELREELPQQGEATERGISRSNEGDLRVVIVKMEREESGTDNEEMREDGISRTEVQQQLRRQESEAQVQETGTSEFLVGNDAKSQEEEGATTAWPRMKEEGEEGRKEELLATPVQQVNTLMVCDFTPPSSELHGKGEGSERNWTVDLETEDHSNGDKQLPSQEGQYVANKDTRSPECIHATSSDTREEKVITSILGEAEEQLSVAAQVDRRGEVTKESIEICSIAAKSALTDTSGAAEVVTGNLTHKLQSDAAEIEHNRSPPSSEWADTITQSPDRNSAAREQVAVELPAPNADTRHPDTEAAEVVSENHEHPAVDQPDLNEGSPTASTTATAALDVFTAEGDESKEDQDSVDKMNSGYSSLSTKLSIKGLSPPKEDESKNRFRKVSLINEADTTDVSQDTVDFDKTSTAVTESDVTDPDLEYKWKNRFEGVTQYKPNKTESSSFSDSLNYRTSDTYTSNHSSASALPEAITCKHHSSAFSSPSPPPEEGVTLGDRLSDRTEVHLSRESEGAGEPNDGWRRRSLVEQEEPAAPAVEREAQREGESERIKSRWDSQQLPASGVSSPPETSHDDADSLKEDDESAQFTGVFKATLVELVSDPAAPPSTPPASPDEDSPNQFDMDSLVDTLKNMGPSLRPRNTSIRAPPPGLLSSLPPIVEDAASPVVSDVPDSANSPAKKMEAPGPPAETLNGLYTLPADLGLKRNTPRDTRSPLELLKQGQDLQSPGTRGLNLPLRASAASSITMRKSFDSSPEDPQSPVLNGNGLPTSATSSRLDSSVIFSSYRSPSIDRTQENGKTHRPLFRTGSLPETGLSNDRMSAGPKELGDLNAGIDLPGTRFERYSFLLNSSSGSLTGGEDINARMSRPPSLGIGSPPASNSPNRLLSPTGSIDLHRPFAAPDSPITLFSQSPGMGMGAGNGPLGTPILQRSFSNDSAVGVQNSLFSNVHGGSQFGSQELGPERNLVSKYRAFPDAYLTKEKEHGKLNPRPGKMYIFDRPGMCGQRLEIRGDVVDATPWELQETISIRVVRGGWVLYEKPNFKGEKFALDEGDIEITNPFNLPEEELQNGQTEDEKQDGERNGEASEEQADTKPARRFIIGSVRRAVRDYSVPEISLFPEENAEGKKVIFRDTSDDARIFGFPIKANSIIINAGLWLVYAQPFFQGIPRVLEVGGYSNPAAWGVEQPYVGSLHPLKVGEPRVENASEPRMVIYDKPYFTGKSRTISTNMRDFMTRTDRQQTAFMYSVGSLKVLGGIWVGYEKEGFRGHQYLLEEGEYQDWRVWGGCDAELRSVRVIRADLTDPMMVMFEQPEEDQEGMQEENTFEVTEAIPDVELFEYKTSTRSIHVLSGAWIAYSHVDFSGSQYILEKGFYNNCADWGSEDTRICSVQPIILAPSHGLRTRNEILLYSEPYFEGECHVVSSNQEAVSEKLLTKSCRVAGISWVLYENKQYNGNLYVLSEGDYPNLASMGCPPGSTIRSVKIVPTMFSIPSISLFGLEGLEGREITTDTEIGSMVEEGFNNHILSVRVNSGCWVICEHSNYRGRQFLLEPIEITNWPKFSSLNTISSMYPVRQKRQFFHIKNAERGHYMSIQGGIEEMKSGRVVVSPEVEPMSDIWFYQDGLIKNRLCPTMSLQVVGNMEPGGKVVLWTEARQPIQSWTAQMKGLITSLTFPGMVLDVKGGKSYDKDHVVIMPENDERPSQQWEIELL